MAVTKAGYVILLVKKYKDTVNLLYQAVEK